MFTDFVYISAAIVATIAEIIGILVSTRKRVRSVGIALCFIGILVAAVIVFHFLPSNGVTRVTTSRLPTPTPGIGLQQTPTPEGPQHILGYVLQVRYTTVLLDSNKEPINDCGHDTLDYPDNVVAIDDHSAFVLNGQSYVRVAYPELCASPNQYDFAGNTVAYMSWNALAETTFAIPSPVSSTQGAIWKPCWDPLQCARQQYPNRTDAIGSGDGLYMRAWVVNGVVDPHWWHGRLNGLDCSLYGRDWNAKP